jgi:hypothetical protein
MVGNNAEAVYIKALSKSVDYQNQGIVAQPF